MDNNEFLHEFVNKIEGNFDIEYNQKVFDMDFDMTATFNQRSAKYMFLKKAEVYAFKNHEYIFYKELNGKLTIDYLNDVKEFLKKNVDEIVHIDEEHMSSAVTFVICSNHTVDKDVIRLVKRFKFYRSFSFGFKGWVNGKIVFVNPAYKIIVTNRLGKDVGRIISGIMEIK
ncbi:hypothetical protein CLTEP_06350 [Clostridium tepidiprofundi DSM 19306]|uniref:DUF8052 domain-containing protein n=1 Tax=Clostridium tepidiprofundi DSM 19306 TaxID=1121338 RepID=A0A151B6E0_9CLOT|nr:hypothetical protein [Clostridium tepidiprofundi]KYH35459.1 hypothetical protein CLTEP_06350 [Clostridium tepidiprofundi DSM 19306]